MTSPDRRLVVAAALAAATLFLPLGESSAFATGARTRAQSVRPTPRPQAGRPLVVVPGKAVERVAADAHHVVWEAGPLESGNEPSRLFERSLAGGRARLLAANVDPGYGLASTSRWIVYAGAGRRLLTVTHAGTKRAVLSTSLLTPVAGRGDRIAWAEQQGDRQRVVVRDMAADRTVLSVSMPRCKGKRCYQLEQVTLADKGVVFARDGTNPDQSVVVRIRFSDRARSEASLPHDPQPDLIPSSAGALYYALGRGWFRWDFGQRRPRLLPFRASPPAPLLAYERGLWLLSDRRGCDSTSLRSKAAILGCWSRRRSYRAPNPPGSDPAPSSRSWETSAPAGRSSRPGRSSQRCHSRRT